MQVALALVAAAGWGLGAFLLARATQSVHPGVSTLALSGIGTAMMLACLPFVHSRFDVSDVLIAGAAGGFGNLGLIAFFSALSRFRMSVIAPTAAATGAVVPVAFGFFAGDRLNLVAWAGVAVAAVAVPLLALERDDSGKPVRADGIALAVLAGLGTAGFIIGIGQAEPTSGLYPLIAAGGVGTAVTGLVLLARGVPLGSFAAKPKLVVTGAVFYGLAQLAFLFATQKGTITIASVVGSLYPAVTVLLAMTLLHERLTRPQQAGLVLAGLGVTLIGFG